MHPNVNTHSYLLRGSGIVSDTACGPRGGFTPINLVWIKLK